MIDYHYTRHQVPRGSRPDTISGGTWYLFKNASKLRLTYQIKMLTFLAKERGARVIIATPKSTRVSNDLRVFVKANSAVLKVKKDG